jgi:hypothetical protein
MGLELEQQPGFDLSRQICGGDGLHNQGHGAPFRAAISGGVRPRFAPPRGMGQQPLGGLGVAIGRGPMQSPEQGQLPISVPLFDGVA